MASRGFLGNITIINAQSMTGTSVITSSIIDARFLKSVGIVATWTGTPVGTFSVQGSMDYKPSGQGDTANSGTWSDMGIQPTQPAGSADTSAMDLQLTAFPWIKLVYTNASGSGTLTAVAGGKGGA